MASQDMIYHDSKIEFASLADATEIALLSREYIEYNLGWEYTPQKIAQLIRHEAKNVVVARDKQQLVGFGIMTYREEEANLDLLAVRLQHRHRGVGRRIVNWLEKVALTAGIITIYVQVREINTGAIKFYQRLGYRVVKQHHGYYQGRETALFMAKDIRRRQ
ncbi:MAG: GNAT family N-acetyltransferase [Gammaproteobacteria bacterium]